MYLARQPAFLPHSSCHLIEAFLDEPVLYDRKPTISPLSALYLSVNEPRIWSISSISAVSGICNVQDITLQCNTFTALSSALLFTGVSPNLLNDLHSVCNGAAAFSSLKIVLMCQWREYIPHFGAVFGDGLLTSSGYPGVSLSKGVLKDAAHPVSWTRSRPSGETPTGG